MDTEQKVELALAPPTEELITVAELRELFQTKAHPNHYIGYEISGKLHIGSLILPGIKIKQLIAAGCNCMVLASDWTAWLNNKLGGDWEKIRTAGKYYTEAFKLLSPKLKVPLSDDIYRQDYEHWARVVRIAKACTLNRIARCLTIMGRREGEKLDFAQYIYPALQAADIKTLDIDIAHAGMDQRKVHMLARDVFPKMGWKKPIALHNHLLPGLTEPARMGFDENEQLDIAISSKMSKSKPQTCIFIHDSGKEIAAKMREAWCPAKVVENNGVLEMIKYVIFNEFKEFKVERKSAYGGDVVFGSYAEVEKEFCEGKLHPLDLKNAVAAHLDKIIKPYREHFQKPKYAKLLDVYKEVKITR